MAYVPQFIPTDKAALQGVLETKQKYYDYNTARQDEASSKLAEMEATRAFDVEQKEKFRTDLSTSLTELDKQFNFDRANSGYAEALSKKLNQLKGDPYWSVKKKADEIEKKRADLKIEKGADYYEDFNPLEAKTLDELRQGISTWQPYDLKEMDKSMELYGKSYQDSNVTPLATDPYSVPGYVRVTTQTGARTVADAEALLASDATVLANAAKGTVFEGKMDNPQLRQRAISVLARNMVGKETDQWLSNKEWEEDQAAKKAAAKAAKVEGPPVTTEQVSTQSHPDLAKPYAVSRASDVGSIDTKIADLEKLANDIGRPTSERAEYRSQIAQLQIEKRRVKQAFTEIEAEYPEIMNNGRQAITRALAESGVPGAAGLATKNGAQIFDMVKEVMVNKSWLGRQIDDEGLRTEIIKVLSNGQDWSKMDAEKRNDIVKAASAVVKEGERWYKGKRDFGTGYLEAIEDAVDKRLEEGERPVYRTTSIGAETTASAKKALTDTMKENIRFFLPMEKDYRQGDGVDWDPKKLSKVEGMVSDPDTQTNFIFDDQNRAYIQLHNPGKPATGTQAAVEPTTVTLEIDPKRSSTDMLEMLTRMTGEQGFMDVLFKGFDMPEGEDISLDASNKTLQHLMKDVAMFKKDKVVDGKKTQVLDFTGVEDVKIRSDKNPDGSRTYSVYIGADDTNPDTYKSMPAMMRDIKSYQDATKAEYADATARASSGNANAFKDLKDTKTIDQYIQGIGMKETGMKNVPNRTGSGAMGFYQFMPKTLSDLGYTAEQIRQFPLDPDMQHEAMKKLTLSNISVIRNMGHYIDENNLSQTDKALLAAAHYGGTRALKSIKNKTGWAFQKQPSPDRRPGHEGEMYDYPSIADYIKQAFGVDLKNIKF
jgi:hypothetical protein